MNSCEFVTSITAIACTIANCTPKEELPTIASFFGQLSATLAAIAVQNEKNNQSSKSTLPDIEVDTSSSLLTEDNA